MGNRPLLISALLFFVLLGVSLWVLRPRTREPARSYFSLKRPAPDTVQVVFGPDTTVLVPGGETGWRLIRPVSYPADPLVVEALLQRLAEAEVLRTFPLTPERWDSYGMRFPLGVLRFAYAGGLAPDTLVVGNPTIDRAQHYVRNASAEEVGLLDGRLCRTYLLKSTVDLRDTRLLPFHVSRVTAFELIDGKGETRVGLQRDAGGRWRVLTPYPGPTSAKKTREYLSSVSHMHIRDFMREGAGPDARFGLQAPRAGIRVRTESGEIRGFVLGDRVPGRDELYARTSVRPHVVSVSTKYLPVIEIGADHFRQTAAVSFGLAATDSVRVRGAKGEWTVRLAGTEIEPAGSTTRDALARWIQLRAVGFEEASAAALRERGLTRPRGRLTWMGEGDTLAVVDIGGEGGDVLALRVSGGREARTAEILLVPAVPASSLWQYFAVRATPAGLGSPESGN